MNRPLLLKTVTVALLAVLLMLPVAMVRELLAERQARRNEAVSGIAEGWGKRQTVAAPYIAVPYERHWTEVKRETVDGKPRESLTERSETQMLRLPAARIQWTADANISDKARGIYKARLYGMVLQLQGAIPVPARTSLEDGKSRYKWGAPRLVVGIADPVGIRAAPEVALGGNLYAFAPGSGDAATAAGLHAPLAALEMAAARTLEFELKLELAGAEAFSIAPRGADTSVTMRADWPHPSFQGRFLPAQHEVAAEGFTARWKISRFAAQGAADVQRGQEHISVSFIEPAGLYQQLERASKYGFLFIGLTFGAFMLFELLRGLAIHPAQYTLVGLALAMFFLLLIALSEHIHFAAAYAIATIACVGLITAYLVHALRNTPLGLGFGCALASVYAVLYALLNAEDYALLGGSVLLFALLALAMFATRHVDWYAVRPSPDRLVERASG